MTTDFEILRLASAYRHEMMNHLQVILGWIQLDQPGRAAEYIMPLRETLFGETRLVHACGGDAAALFLRKRGLAEACGVELFFDAAPAVRDFTWRRPEAASLVDGLIEGALWYLNQTGVGRQVDVGLDQVADCWLITLRIAGYSGYGEALVDDLGRVLAARGRPFDFQGAWAALAAIGGHWLVLPEEDATLVRLSWPRTG